MLLDGESKALAGRINLKMQSPVSGRQSAFYHHSSTQPCFSSCQGRDLGLRGHHTQRGRDPKDGGHDGATCRSQTLGWTLASVLPAAGHGFLFPCAFSPNILKTFLCGTYPHLPFSDPNFKLRSKFLDEFFNLITSSPFKRSLVLASAHLIHITLLLQVCIKLHMLSKMVAISHVC